MCGLSDSSIVFVFGIKYKNIFMVVGKMTVAIDNLPPEVMYQFLVPLSYEDTISYCSINRAANSICQDTWFWIQKLDYKLQYPSGHKPSYYIMNHEHPDDKGIDIYKRWMRENLGSGLYDKIKSKYNDMVFWMIDRYHKYITPSSEIYEYAAIFDNQEVLSWLTMQGVLPDIHVADYAARNGKLDLLQKLELEGILPDVYGANSAASNGHLDILKWLELRGIFPNTGGVNYALSNGHMNVVRYLVRKDISPNEYIYPGSQSEETVLRGLNKAEELRLSIGVFPANLAAADGFLKVLQWLEIRRVRPNQTGANFAAMNNRLDTLIWLDQRGISPAQFGINMAIAKNNTEVLAYLSQKVHSLHPTIEAANLAVKYGNLSQIQWLKTKYGFIPNKYAADDAAERGYLNILQYLEHENILPDTFGANYALKFGHFDVLEWLIQRGIMPSMLS